MTYTSHFLWSCVSVLLVVFLALFLLGQGAPSRRRGGSAFRALAHFESNCDE